MTDLLSIAGFVAGCGLFTSGVGMIAKAYAVLVERHRRPALWTPPIPIMRPDASLQPHLWPEGQSFRFPMTDLDVELIKACLEFRSGQLRRLTERAPKWLSRKQIAEWKTMSENYERVLAKTRWVTPAATASSTSAQSAARNSCSRPRCGDISTSNSKASASSAG